MTRHGTASSFLRHKRVWVTSHCGLVGAAIVRRLWRERCEIVLAGRSQLDLLRQNEVETWFRRQRPDVVFLAEQATVTGGFEAPASALHRPLLTNINILAAARETGATTLVSVVETGVGPPADPLDPRNGRIANSPQSLSRLALIGLTQGYVREHGCRFMVLLASSVYGADRGGVSRTPRLLQSLFRLFHEAAAQDLPQVEIDGGDVFPYGLINADDLADAAVFISRSFDGQDPVHCRLSEDASLRDIAERLAELAGYRGRIMLRMRTDGQHELPLPSTGIPALGWRPRISFEERLRELHDNWLRRAADLN